MQVVPIGWQVRKHLNPQEVQAYFFSRDELSVRDGLLCKGNRVVIPTSLQQVSSREYTAPKWELKDPYVEPESLITGLL